MAFVDQDFASVLSELPEGAFAVSDGAARKKWLFFVCSVDDSPKDKHPIMFYAAVARQLAETMGSVEPVDYADAHVRDQTLAVVKSGTKPFDKEHKNTIKNHKYHKKTLKTIKKH